MNKRHFQYERDFFISRFAAITAAIDIDDESHKAKIAYAFCSPSEQQFVKEKGRRIAAGRLDSGKYIEVELPIEKSKHFVYEHVFNGILDLWFLRVQPQPKWVEKERFLDALFETIQ